MRWRAHLGPNLPKWALQQPRSSAFRRPPNLPAYQFTDLPSWQEDNTMTQMSIAEAIRQGIREEMRARPVRLLHRRGHRHPRRLRRGVHRDPGPVGRIRPRADPRHPDLRAGAGGGRGGRGLAGLRPIADVQYSDFLFLAMDQLVNNAAKMTYMSGGVAKVPMVMRTPVGATPAARSTRRAWRRSSATYPG